MSMANSESDRAPPIIERSDSPLDSKSELSKSAPSKHGQEAFTRPASRTLAPPSKPRS